MPRSPVGCRGQAPSSRTQGIRRIPQPRTASPGDWSEDSGGDRTPASLAEARKAYHGSGPQWITPRLPACYVSLQPSKQSRTGFSASTQDFRFIMNLILQVTKEQTRRDTRVQSHGSVARCLQIDRPPDRRVFVRCIVIIDPSTRLALPKCIACPSLLHVLEHCRG